MMDFSVVLFSSFDFVSMIFFFSVTSDTLKWNAFCSVAVGGWVGSGWRLEELCADVGEGTGSPHDSETNLLRVATIDARGLRELRIIL